MSAIVLAVLIIASDRAPSTCEPNDSTRPFCAAQRLAAIADADDRRNQTIEVLLHTADEASACGILGWYMVLRPDDEQMAEAAVIFELLRGHRTCAEKLLIVAPAAMRAGAIRSGQLRSEIVFVLETDPTVAVVSDIAWKVVPFNMVAWRRGIRSGSVDVERFCVEVAKLPSHDLAVSMLLAPECKGRPKKRQGSRP